jgi:CBS domain-containing protein
VEPLAQAAVPVASLFHRVGSVLPEDQNLVVAAPDDLAGDVLAVMGEHGYSQVPVRAGAEVIGVFSYRSFARNAPRYHHLRKPLVELPIEAFVEGPFPLIDPADELSDIFDALDVLGFVLVGSRSRLEGIVTPGDVLRWLHEHTEPFVRLSEIERSLRQIVRHKLAPGDIADCARRALKAKYTERPDAIPVELDEMTLDELRLVVTNGDNWKLLEPALGRNRDIARGYLDDLPDLRNDVFHFRRELEADEREKISAARWWLLTRVSALGVRDTWAST